MKNKAVIAFFSVLMAVSLTAVLSQSALMQEATPFSESETTGGPAFPAQIQKGTCDNIGDLAFPLADVGLARENSVTAPIVGSGNVTPAYTSVTQYQNVVSLDDLVNGDYVITVSQSADKSDQYVACGNIGGSQVGNTIMFGLLSQNDSNYDGTALMSQDKDGTLNIVIYVLDTTGAAEVQGTPMAAASPQTTTQSTSSSSAAATPESNASPAANAAPSTSVTLGMYDIGFTKNDITVPANQDITVTLNNTGVIKHNFTIEDQNVSVDVQPGETGTATFNLPAGDYTYYCDVPGHRAAGMVGTLHVV